MIAKRRGKKIKRRYEELTFNLDGGRAYHRELEGRDHLVVPCVMITEGVHNGSRGKGFYPASETAATSIDWNHMPVVADHPESERGVPNITARTEELINNTKVGVVLNTRWNRRQRRLQSEVWLDYERTLEIDPRIIKHIEQKKKIEVSTGLFLNRQKRKGTFNGESYTWVARDQRPDHLAILFGEKGACSIKKGCGLLANSRKKKGSCQCKTLNRFFSADKRKKLAEKGDALPDGSFPISNGGDLKNAIRAFGRAKDKAETKRHIIKMAKRLRMDHLIPGDWSRVSNSESHSPAQSDPALSIKDLTLLTNSNRGGMKMLSTKKKTRMVRRLINNSGVWGPKDKRTLMEMKDSAFKKLYRTALETDESEGGVLKSKKVVKNKAAATEKVDNADRKKKKKKRTSINNFADWRKTAPPEVLAVVNAGQKMIDRRRKALIEVITNNESNVFSDKWLNSQEPDVLEGIAALAKVENGDGADENEMFVKGFSPNYAGAIGAVSNRRADDDDEEDDDDEPLLVQEIFPVKNREGKKNLKKDRNKSQGSKIRV